MSWRHKLINSNARQFFKGLQKPQLADTFGEVSLCLEAFQGKSFQTMIST